MDEFVIPDVPQERDGETILIRDGEDSVEPPGLPGVGRVAITDSPSLVRNRTEIPVYPVETFLDLRNGGE